MWEQYTWVFGLSFIVAFGCAFGIGANDVANSFGTSVGAKAITIWQAVIIASICEFLGAVLLGANVTDTIKSGIAKSTYFTATPELLMFAMFGVMCTCCFWDNFACHMELPVSTTHTTIGAIVGATVVLRGFKAVVWCAEQPGFPYIKGMVPIFLSWVCSPVLAAICVIILYGIILRPFVLRSQHSFARSFFVIPVLVGITFFVIVYFIIQTGNKNATWSKKVEDGKAIWIGIIPAVFFGILTLALFMPLIKKKILAEEEASERAVENAAVANGLHVDPETGEKQPPLKEIGGEDINLANNKAGVKTRAEQWWDKQKQNKVVNAIASNPFSRVITYGSTYDCHACVQEGHKDFDQSTANVWLNAETFDIKTEKMFRYLQVFSACVMSLAHGSNDVANAMGPFAAVYGIWTSQSIASKSKVPEWILVIGGAGIVCGLALYGYKIMRVIGVKSAKLTNSRGFCCELSTAIVVMVASRYGLPVSTTQTIMGAVWMMGLFEGVRGLNYKMVARTWIGWFLTLIVAAFVSGGLSALLMYSPQKTAADDIVTISRALGNDALLMLRQINSTGNANTAQLRSLNGTLAAIFYRPPNVASEEVGTFNQILALYNTTFA